MSKITKTILITGATQRIGKVIATYFYNRGWNVAIHYNKSSNKIFDLKNEFSKHNSRVNFFRADLTSQAECKRLITEVVDHFGKIDCLVNNAAVFIDDSLETNSRETWDIHMETNLWAPFVLSKEFYQVCKYGNIINIIDQCVTKVRKNYLSYSLSKTALWSLTKVLALSMAPNVRVNAIGPGLVIPSSYQTVEQFQNACQSLPLRNNTSPLEIASTIYFITERQTTLTGQIVMLDGGEHLGRGVSTCQL